MDSRLETEKRTSILPPTGRIGHLEKLHYTFLQLADRLLLSVVRSSSLSGSWLINCVSFRCSPGNRGKETYLTACYAANSRGLIGNRRTSLPLFTLRPPTLGRRLVLPDARRLSIATKVPIWSGLGRVRANRLSAATCSIDAVWIDRWILAWILGTAELRRLYLSLDDNSCRCASLTTQRGRLSTDAR